MSGAHVVLLEDDDTGEDGVAITRVIVNGTDVGIMSETPTIKVGVSGQKTVTTVQLTLIVSRLEIKGELADGDRRQPRAGFAADIS